MGFAGESRVHAPGPAAHKRSPSPGREALSQQHAHAEAALPAPCVCVIYDSGKLISAAPRYRQTIKGGRARVRVSARLPERLTVADGVHPPKPVAQNRLNGDGGVLRWSPARAEEQEAARLRRAARHRVTMATRTLRAGGTALNLD